MAAPGTADDLKAHIGRRTVELIFDDEEDRERRDVRCSAALKLPVTDGAETWAESLELHLADRGLPVDPHRPPQAHPRRGLPGSDMTDSLIFIGRSLRRSVRSVDALLTAIFLPVMIMLLFVYVFGGPSTPAALRRLRGAGHHRPLRRLRRRRDAVAVAMD